MKTSDLVTVAAVGLAVFALGYWYMGRRVSASAAAKPQPIYGGLLNVNESLAVPTSPLLTQAQWMVSDPAWGG